MTKTQFSDILITVTPKVLIVMPRRLTAKGGGITRMVGYLRDSIASSGSDATLSFFPTRTTDRRGLKELSLLWQMIVYSVSIGLRKDDIVHIHVAPRGSTTRKAFYARTASFFGKKIILHLHGSGYDEFFRGLPQRRRQSTARFFQAANALIVLGDGWKKFAVNELQVSPEKVHVVDNGAPDPGMLAPRRNEKCRFIFVGTVGERKGVDVLLQAFAKLPAEKKWHVTICGNGSVREFSTLADELGLHAGDVEFTGWQDVDGVRRHLLKSDVFVLPSKAENQPIAILEAMALGLPVISTNVGDIPNQVQDKETGFIVERNDVPALAEALLRFIDNRSLVTDMGDKGRERFSQRYTVEGNAKKIVALYRLVAGTN